MQLHPHTSTTALHSVRSTSLNSFYKYNLTVGTYLEDIMVQKKKNKKASSWDSESLRCTRLRAAGRLTSVICQSEEVCMFTQS